MHNSILLLIVTATLLSCSTSGNKEKLKNSKQAMLYYDYGTNLLVQKKYTEALDNLLKAYNLSPDDQEINNNLGMAYYLKQKPQLAMAHFNKVLAINEKNSDARSNLASVHFSLGHLELAKKEYEKVLQDMVYTKNYRTYYNLGLIELKSHNISKALGLFEKSYENNENYCPASYQIALKYREINQIQKALEWAKKSVKGKCYQEPASLYQLGLIYKEVRKFQLARESFLSIKERFFSSSYSSLANIELEKIKDEKIDGPNYLTQEKIKNLHKVIQSPDF